jgi:fructan beta-fructosidase
MDMGVGSGDTGTDSLDPWRPRVHFSAQTNWINDPNGLIWHDGEFHLFFQYNPQGTDWGHMSWGHAVSSDLVIWHELPIALHEDDESMVFSGSVVLDVRNTSGFGTDDIQPLVAIFTSCPHGGGRQVQSLAFSTDRGRTWTKYIDNPVLSAEVDDFRDPKVFWDAVRDRWLMVIALPVERRIRFYASSNLRQWVHLSDFGPAGATQGVWECPDLFALPVEGDPHRQVWVLLVSLNPGGPAGGSGTQWFLGDFDGTTFTPLSSDAPEDPSVEWLDHGADCYAAVTFNDVPAGRRVALGWMSNWEYARDLPTTGWKGAMTIPRELSLRTGPGGIRLCSSPVEQLSTMRGSPVVSLIDVDVDVDRVGVVGVDASGTALDIELVFEPTSGTSGLDVRVGEGERTRIGYAAETGVLFIDRTRAHSNALAGLQTIQKVSVPLLAGAVHLRVILDSCSVEVFAQDGSHVLTDLIFPSATSTGMALFSEGSARIRALTVWPFTGPHVRT